VADLYADQNISLDLVRLLCQNGHNATTAREERFDRAPDDEHLLTAAERCLVLITQDADDFLLLHSAWLRWPAAWRIPNPPQHTGIVILEPRHYEQQFTVLNHFLAVVTSLANELFRWWHSDGWHQWDRTSRTWMAHG
jgi:hypothetical protein